MYSYCGANMSDEVEKIEEELAENRGPRMRTLWDILLKINLIIIPPMMGAGILWATWVTKSVMALQYKDTLTSTYATTKDVEIVKVKMLSDVSKMLASHNEKLEKMIGDATKEIKSLTESIRVDFRHHINLGGHPLMESRMEDVEDYIRNHRRSSDARGT